MTFCRPIKVNLASSLLKMAENLLSFEALLRRVVICFQNLEIQNMRVSKLYLGGENEEFLSTFEKTSKTALENSYLKIS